MAAGVAAAVGRERRRVVEALRAAGATSAQQAVSADRVGHVRFHVIARLEARGVIHRTDDGRVWLDEAAWEVFNARLHRIALVMVGVALVAILVAAGMSLR
ncbi:hypothetical protein [Cognatilysobacter lacus]|uniref:ArsR family transcriptional regulator n=1 Tax=Cognatilysobacter lacus TaxID=1643323 RepID=A0A5D8Z6E5_9GAMM|nr:hypothetical protein [Lysobacter lacus]TZF90351.1 hypothetical protein FW784_05665 [Lysobacter lacus]